MVAMLLNKKDGSLTELKTEDILTDNKKDNPQNKNMALWEAVEKTNPAHAKEYSNGTFKGTAIKPLYSIQKATEQWGEMGNKWGARELEHFIEDGVWFSKIELWHPTGKVEQWGATKFKYQSKDGRVIVDDEAAKKAFTDAVTKCLSWLGFSADIHMGRFDDSKYVEELKKEFAPAPVIKKATEEENKLFDNFKKTIKASETIEGLDAFIAAAKGNMAKLPEDLKAELRNVIAETKLNLGGR